LIPGLDNVSQRSALQIVENEFIAHDTEFLLDIGSDEMINPLLKRILEICVGMIAGPGD
jgi:hypothetical protein